MQTTPKSYADATQETQTETVPRGAEAAELGQSTREEARQTRTGAARDRAPLGARPSTAERLRLTPRCTSLRRWPGTEPAVHAHAQPQYLRQDLAGAREKQSVRQGWVGTPTPHLPWRTEDGAETSPEGDGRQCGHLAVLRDRPRVRPQSQSLTSDG